jgi:uncharacterized protein YbjT (DUF2867 family)
MSNSLHTLVIGATGKQGSQVTHRLLRHGHTVRALTRTPDSPSGRELQTLGAEVVAGDLGDRGSLERALSDIDTVFAALPATELWGDETELRHGLSLAASLKAARITHLVYSSVANADRNTGLWHFGTKRKIEEEVERLGIPWTIIGPVHFMENALGAPSLAMLREGQFGLPLSPAHILPQIAVADIADFAVLALEDPTRFTGRRVDVVSEMLSGEEAATILSEVTRRRIEYIQLPTEEIKALNEDYSHMFEWFNRVGYQVDPAALRRDYPEVGWHTFAGWAREQDWGILEAD